MPTRRQIGLGLLQIHSLSFWRRRPFSPGFKFSVMGKVFAIFLASPWNSDVNFDAFITYSYIGRLHKTPSGLWSANRNGPTPLPPTLRYLLSHLSSYRTIHNVPLPLQLLEQGLYKQSQMLQCDWTELLLSWMNSQPQQIVSSYNGST